MTDHDAPDDPRPGPLDDGSVVDALPDDLNASDWVGVYSFPDNKRRRIPGLLYVAIGAGGVAAWALTGDDAVLANPGFGWGGAALIAIGLYIISAGFPTGTDEKQALERATAAVDFPVGHASAQLGWRGLRSRPTWRILLYSAEEPPEKRGLFLVDSQTGDILEHFVEDNPEDWSGL